MIFIRRRNRKVVIQIPCGKKRKLAKMRKHKLKKRRKKMRYRK